MQAAIESRVSIRPLGSADLDAVVAIDHSIEGRSRRTYFERRLNAALREPALHAQFAAVGEQGVAGYILARVLEGEFGRNESELRFEAVGVRGDSQGKGIGKQLFGALEDWSRRHGVREMRTQAAWNNHRMMAWLDTAGFRLAPNHVVDCPVRGGEYVEERDEPVTMPVGEGPAQEVNFGGQSGNDFERLARDTADVRPMTAADLSDIVRIDRAITGQDRRSYIGHKLNETLVDSAIRVSLTARRDDVIVGFVMARADLGDYGRTEPVAVIDTIGVDPAYAHQGVGRALLSQLFLNLGALRIERVETQVAPRDLGLLGFLYDVGFAPSQRLPFAREIA
ncbi:MAG: GNAT family N-acetyltransferase [Burkholderiales bacterium]|nr:GNAT family N-acetyltransferase [Burkholderiales bacterium]